MNTTPKRIMVRASQGIRVFMLKQHRYPKLGPLHLLAKIIHFPIMGIITLVLQ